MEQIGKFIITVGMMVVSGFIMAFPMMWTVNYLFTARILHQIFGVWSFDWNHGLMLAMLVSVFHSSYKS